MKKNKLKYALSIALIGVWGLFGFRVYEKLNKRNNYLPITHTAEYVVPETSARNFNLSLDYQDPFLDKPFKKPKATLAKLPASTKKKKPPKKSTVKKKIVFPRIVYQGNIKTDDNLEVALLKVNGKFVQLRKANTYNELKLLKVYQDSIRVAYLGEERTIKKVR